MRLIGTLKLSHQLLLLLLSIPLFLVISLLYYSARQHVTIQNKPLEQLALSTSSTVAEKIDRNLDERYSDVQAFAFNSEAAKVLEHPQQDSTLQNFINSMMTYYKCYDLMMLCDISGKVIFLNTKDRFGRPLTNYFLLEQNMNDREWFRSSIVVGGPVGGAYFSDFNNDEDIERIYNGSGYGIDFSAPVRNMQGQIVGVWRNRVSWHEVTQQIRKEAELNLQNDVKGSLILLMDKQGHLIDADRQDNIMKVTIGKNNLFKQFDFEYAGIPINEEDFLYGWSESEGFNAYLGNRWKFLTLIPKVKLTDPNIYLQSDWTKLMLFSIVLLLIGVGFALLFVKSFTKRIGTIQQSVQKLSQGEPQLIEKINLRDEIGEMSEALNTLSGNFQKMAGFANEIGDGNLTASFSALGEKDLLGSSLLKMKHNLETSQTEIIRQKWVSDTLTALSELLRSSEEHKVMYQKIISFLARSVQAHQAALFIVKPSGALPVIKLKAGFALSEERLKQEPLMWGENYIGQSIKDNEILTLKDLPEDYSQKINSGLGEANPVVVMIFPIHFNQQTLGAFELSSFKTFDPYYIQFLEKAAESLGAYLIREKVRALV